MKGDDGRRGHEGVKGVGGHEADGVGRGNGSGRGAHQQRVGWDVWFQKIYSFIITTGLD